MPPNESCTPPADHPPESTPYLREPGYALRYRDARFRTGSGQATHRREVRAVQRLLDHPVAQTARAASSARPWLDMPAGAGRLSALLGPHVVLVDRDPAMVRASWDAAEAPDHALRLAAAGVELPFADQQFAGCLCARLMQHIPAAPERVALLRELRRVTAGPLIVSFFDAHSIQHLRRRASRFVGKRRSGRTAISRRTFINDLQRSGWKPVAFAALHRGLSEQTFVLATAEPAQ